MTSSIKSKFKSKEHTGILSGNRLSRLVILIVLILARTSWCFDYYVSSSSGSDAGLATEDSPWKTLKRVGESKLLPGDVIWLKRGDSWWGSLTLTDSGTREKPIKVMPYPYHSSEDNPKIFGGKKILYPKEWIKHNVDGKSFYKCKIDPRRTIYGIWDFEGGRVHGDYVYKGDTPVDCQSENDFVYSNGWLWILTDEKPRSSEGACVVYGDLFNGICIFRADFNIVEGIDVFCTTWGGRNYHGGIGVVGRRYDYVKGVTLKNCSSNFNYYQGIGAVYTDELTIEGCKTMHNARAGGIYASSGSRKLKILDCESCYNGRHPDIQGCDRGGISVGGGGDWHLNVIVAGCRSHHNGIWYGGYIDGGIHFYKVKNGLIKECESYENGAAGIMINGAGSYEEGEDSTVKECKVYENGMAPGRSRGGKPMYAGGIVCFRPARVKNNVVAMNNLDATSHYKAAGIFFSMPSGEYHCEITQNVLYNNAIAVDQYEISIGKSFTKNYIAGNCYFNTYKDPRKGTIVFYGGLGPMTWDDYNKKENEMGLKPGSLVRKQFSFKRETGDKRSGVELPPNGWCNSE